MRFTTNELPCWVPRLDAPVQALLLNGGSEAAHMLDLLDASAVFPAVHIPAVDDAQDPILLAAAVAHRLRHTAVFVEVDISRKHPVNVARALVSLAHLYGFRIGWGLRAVPEAALSVSNIWLAVAPAAAGDAARARNSVRQEFAHLVYALARSWPHDSLIGDRAQGWWGVEGAIRPLAHRGAFDIAGSLNVPGVPHGALPFLSFDSDPAFRGHVHVADQSPEPADIEGVSLFGVSAPSNAGLGAASSRRILHYATGLRTARDLLALKRAASLARPAGYPEASGTIWQLLGVRPSIADVY